MYYAKGMRDLLQSTQLTREFFDCLDEFQFHYVEMCFKQSLESKMGMMTEIEAYNYNLYEDFRLERLEEKYGIDPEYLKKAA